MSRQQGVQGLPIVKGYSSQSVVDQKTESKQNQKPRKKMKASAKRKASHKSMGSLQLEDNRKRLFEIDFGKLDDVLVPGFDYSKYDRKASPKKKAQGSLSKSMAFDSLKQDQTLSLPEEPPSKTAWEETTASAKKNKATKQRMRKVPSIVMAKDGGEMPADGWEGIQYFARHGQGGAYKFLYCVREETVGDDFRPYDLVIVPSEEAINREHYVMSAKGLIRNVPGQPSDFISLEEWVRGSMNFNVIRSMKSFKMHRAFKSFSAWSKYTRQSKFRQKQRQGVCKTFAANPSYCESVIIINGLLQDLEKVPTITGFKRNPYLQSFTESDFAATQHRTRENAKAAMEKIMEKIISHVEQTSKNILRLAGEGNDPLSDGGKQKSLVEMGMIKRSMNKHKSITAIKEEELARKRMKKTIHADSAALGDFIRFVDYMALKSFFNKGEEDTNVVRNICDKSERVGFFLTTLSFKPDSPVVPVSTAYELGISGVGTNDWKYSSWPQGSEPKDPTMLFTPSEVSVQRHFSHTLEASHSLLSNLPRIINMPFFNDIMKRKFSILKITDLLNRSRIVNQNRMSILQKVKDDFKVAATHTVSYSNLRGLYDFSNQFDKTMFENGDFNYDSINNILQLLDVWSERIQTAKAGQACGVAHLESKTLQDELTRVIPTATYAACARLQEIARDACKAQLELYKERLSFMKSRPTNLKMYYSLHERIKAHEEEIDALHEKNAVVENMYTLLRQRSPKLISTDDAVQLDELIHASEDAKEQLVDAKMFAEDALGAMKDKLEEGIKVLDVQSKEYNETLCEGIFVDTGSVNPSAVITALDNIREKIIQIKEKAETYTNMKLDLCQEKDFLCRSAVALEKVFVSREETWGLYNKWRTEYGTWMSSDLSIVFNPEKNKTGLDGEAVEKTVDSYFQMGSKLKKKVGTDDPVVPTYLKELKKIRDVAPFLAQLGHPSILSRHWKQVYGILGVAYDETTTIVTLAYLMENGLLEPANKEQIDGVCGAAGKEYSLLKAMDKMEEEWQDIKFNTVAYKETGTAIFRGVDEIEEVLDDQIVKTQAMRGSRYIKPFEKRIVAWSNKLSTVEDILQNLLKMQGTWLYLEPIFSSPDIRKQMPVEAKRFLQVDQVWKENMTETQEDARVLLCAERDGLLRKLVKSNELLEVIQKGLADYLNKKRVFFPRFFFLSNDELLEILSETKDPTKVEPHLKKCFEGIAALKFDKEQKILGMISSEKECVLMPYEPLGVEIVDPAKARGCVEVWLDQLEDVMRKSVAYIFDQAMVDYEKMESEGKRTDWLQKWPGQIVLGVSQTFWTQETTKALDKGIEATKAYVKQHSKYITDIIEMVRDPKLPKLVRKTVSPLVVLDVHARDVVQVLVDLKLESSNDFDWLSQMRYYWTEGGASWQSGKPESVECKMINASRMYAYEYLGNSARLVVTPLTDRCYRTLMTAIDLDYGGAPAGPAGTGKTETVKDLGKAVATQCVVYNCSDSLDYLAMGKFFKGLSGTGAWACFDEFNRITLEVLSVVAQQILTIQRAKVAKLDRFDFEGENIKLRRTCNVFVTMNPGYAGRQELPDNLKVLMRSVAMMVPDYAKIGQIILYSMGFSEGFSIANKIVMLYKLCSEQLSKQMHYDYGMRAVVTVLRACGNLKRRFPDDNEYVLGLQAIIDVNLPKFLAPDVPLFNGITSDLFPGIELPKIDNALMMNKFIEFCKINRLKPTDYFLKKVFEIYQMMLVRHGFMIVGMPYAGKSEALNLLSQSLSSLHMDLPEDDRWKKVYYQVINPKSISMGHLYGEFDAVSHEWSDGVLAVAYRNFAKPTIGNPEDLKWVWLDGPVDAIWIENMNTVLDDNKKLCLMNGEMIMMSSTMSMIFEPMDLEVASPATVSRVGVIYMEPHRMGWDPNFYSWMVKFSPVLEDANTEEETGSEVAASEKTWHFSEDHQKIINTLVNYYVDPCISFIRKKCSIELSDVLDQTLVVSLLRIVQSMIEAELDKYVEEDETHFVGKLPFSTEAIHNIFIFALVWSVGAVLDGTGRKAFDEFLRLYTEDPLILRSADMKGVATLLALKEWTATEENCPPFPSFPEGLIVYDCFFDIGTSSWVRWTKKAEEYVIPSDASFTSIVVPTAVTEQVTYLLRLAVRNNFPFLVVGPTGTGKSRVIEAAMNNSLPESTKPCVVSYTAKTTALQAQNIIDANFDKRRRGIYGPPLGSRSVIFVDDLNTPEVEEYGAQPPVELIRQLLANSGYYDLQEMAFKTIVDTAFIAAMGPPGGGRNKISPRSLRHFSIVSLTQFDDHSLTFIFKRILKWHFSNISGNEALIPTLVNATLHVYNGAKASLRPTPKKSHYTFNLRDFSRIVQGICLLNSADVEDVTALYVKLWLHESSRVIADRLVDDKDYAWFIDSVTKITKMEFDVALDDAFFGGSGKDLGENVRQLYFGGFSGKVGDGMGEYIEISKDIDLEVHMTENLSEYNADSKNQMDLVMFGFAVQHVSKIMRVLSMPGGNMLLVGVGGSGRQSLTRLASYVYQFNLKQISLSKSYGVVEWRDDMKDIIRDAGTAEQPVVFLFCDIQVKNSLFLEDINGMLNTGQIPNLFQPDERISIIDAVRAPAKAETGNELSNPELWEFFKGKVKEQLHIVLAFSPIGDAFRTRLQKFPSLVNCCTIDWFQAWPSDALLAVSEKKLRAVETDEKVKRSIVKACEKMHNGVRDLSITFQEKLKRFNYVTPTSYLELIRTFTTSFGTVREKVSKAKQRYIAGLEKLAFASEQVSEMQVQLTAMLPGLEQAKINTAALMKQIEEKLPGVQKMSTEVAAEAAVVQKSADECKVMKEECEADLAEAIPLLEDAMKALNTLKPSDITEVKSMKTPPGGVVLVLTAVCHMMGVKPEKIKDPKNDGKKIQDYWGPAKKHLLGDSKFLQKLKDYDKDNIAPKVIKILRKDYVNNPDFEPAVIKKASVAAYGLCKWVRAMEAYDRVAKVVEPKKRKLVETEAELAETMATLNAKKEQLATVENDLQTLENRLNDAKATKAKLEADVDLCEKKLTRAKQLIDGLGGEQSRWQNNVNVLEQTLQNTVGDVFIAAGMVAYLGVFTSEYREDAVKSWVKFCHKLSIPCSAKPTLMNTFGDPIQVRQWNIQGLPTDGFSIDNGIIIKQSARWPLLIDPQGQANMWIKKHEQENQLKVIKMTDANFIRTIENAIQFGSPILLENIGEELDPSLDGLLMKAIFKQGGIDYIRLGDNAIEYSNQFRFYMTSKLRNPHYLPEVAVKVTLINFMTTPAGLQDQLLTIVVAEEHPDLAAEKERLIIEGAQSEATLKQCEDDILHVLSTSEGNILEDAAAINALNNSKKVSTEINKKQAVAKVTEAKIDKVRVEYVPVAFHAQLLYFCISDLVNIEPTYAYALRWFRKLFVSAIQNSEQSDDISARVELLNSYFTYLLYCNVCRSLLVKDKEVFSFLLTTRILQGNGKLKSDEFYFFLTGGVAEDNSSNNPDSSWIGQRMWDEICRLSTQVGAFAGIDKALQERSDLWKKVYDATDAHREKLPLGWSERIDAFQKLLLLRAIRPDKVCSGVQDFIILKMGEKYVTPPPFALSDCFEDANASTPLVFVLSAGSDPMENIFKFSQQRGIEFDSISLGQGQGPKAEVMIDKAQRAGTWVVLQNCHLCISWMSKLEYLCEEMSQNKGNFLHKNYRLWCTTYPHPQFPSSILQNAVKMTIEAPKGLKANLLGSYMNDPISSPGYLATVEKAVEFRRLLYSLCFFHAVVQERREFGSLGWNNPYEFNESDLRISVKQLAIFLDLYDRVEYKALNYCFGQCNYGGRVTDDKDRRCLVTILKRFFNPGVLSDDHEYCQKLHSYKAPKDGEHQEYIDHIQELSLVTPTQIFMMHENASMTKDQNETNNLLSALLKTQNAGGSSGGGLSPEEIVSGWCKQTASKLKDNFDMEYASLNYPVRLDESMNTVLLQELKRFNALNDVIKSGLQDVINAIAGITVMSDELHVVFNSFYFGIIPAVWLQTSYPSLKTLAAYILDYLDRLKFFGTWLEKGIPDLFWISGFYFNAAFLTGTLQNFARKYQIPIDSVGFDFKMLKTTAVDKKPEDGSYVQGLFLDGARWDKEVHVLADPKPKELFSPTPIIWLEPQKVVDIKHFPQYKCPVYITSERRGVLSTTGHSTNFVMYINFPSDRSEDEWIEAGVACLCQLD